ncbi:hypothetical protein ABT288_11250 [Streptomyces sp. NPDC001093]|uniref:hypothetical protein n=1 Tax=Streptomyces sp. NPDC001093 TaxID=3154376 RepID=UPI003322775B
MAGSLNDPESLAAAMSGGGRLRDDHPLRGRCGGGNCVRVERSWPSSAKRACPHLVCSAVTGAGQESGIPHFDSKTRIEVEPIPRDVSYTILEPTYFFDNAPGDAEPILNGVLDLPLSPDRPLQQLTSPDLGAFTRRHSRAARRSSRNPLDRLRRLGAPHVRWRGRTVRWWTSTRAAKDNCLA